MGSPAHRHCVSSAPHLQRGGPAVHPQFAFFAVPFYTIEAPECARPRRAHIGDLGVGAVPRSAWLVINAALLGA
ncbi:Os08g0256500 [Oryza sativa Japonica Group]|jgi:hypothetical protein|uniref:Os08g0256500 protein n=1 Tax=Oryza sativa subsp. japonica TaxID=39947 RepID=A0A0P0XDT8_ORYSJ|nr:Os08g0256500 [Oryza sativa Japonica Group]